MLHCLQESKYFMSVLLYSLIPKNTWDYYMLLIISDLIMESDVSVNITMFPSHSEYWSTFFKTQRYYTFQILYETHMVPHWIYLHHWKYFFNFHFIFIGIFFVSIAEIFICVVWTSIKIFNNSLVSQYDISENQKYFLVDE